MPILRAWMPQHQNGWMQSVLTAKCLTRTMLTQKFVETNYFDEKFLFSIEFVLNCFFDGNVYVCNSGLTPVQSAVLALLNDIGHEPHSIVDTIFTLPIVVGRIVIEVVTRRDYYISRFGHDRKHLLADLKLRQRVLWRRGWKVAM